MPTWQGGCPLRRQRQPAQPLERGGSVQPCVQLRLQGLYRDWLPSLRPWWGMQSAWCVLHAGNRGPRYQRRCIVAAIGQVVCAYRDRSASCCRSHGVWGWRRCEGTVNRETGHPW